PSPAAADHAEVREAQHNGLGEISEHHAHIAYRLESANVTISVFELPDRNTEQVPRYGFARFFMPGVNTIDNIFTTDLKLPRTQVNVILIVHLQFIQRVIRIEVLVVRIGASRSGHDIVTRDGR